MRKQECISKNPHIFASYFLRNECTKCGGGNQRILFFLEKVTLYLYENSIRKTKNDFAILKSQYLL